MTIEEIERKVQEEKEQIISVLSFFCVPEKKIELYKPIIENVVWMGIKLDEARDTIKNSQLAISYDNGGGQKGIRENPLFKGYNSLWKSYTAGMGQILSLIPEVEPEAKEEAKEKQQTMLELIRSKHSKVG